MCRMWGRCAGSGYDPDKIGQKETVNQGFFVKISKVRKVNLKEKPQSLYRARKGGGNVLDVRPCVRSIRQTSS